MHAHDCGCQHDHAPSELKHPFSLTSYALKAEKAAPVWFRDAVQLKNLLHGAWGEVSQDFIDKLLKLLKEQDWDAITKLLKESKDLGADAVRLLKKGPDAIFYELHSKANTFWKLHAIENGIEGAIGLSKKYQKHMANLQANQVKSFVEKYPERILHPEIERQLEYLQKAKHLDAVTISNVAERLERFATDEEYWGKLSGVQVAAGWHADGVEHAIENNIVEGVIVGPVDEKTCMVCLNMVGMLVNLEKAREKYGEALNCEDPDDFAKIMPFPRLKDVDNITPEEIEAKGFLPPFHPIGAEGMA